MNEGLILLFCVIVISICLTIYNIFKSRNKKELLKLMIEKGMKEEDMRLVLKNFDLY